MSNAMKLFKKITIVSLFTLLMVAIFAGIVGMTGALAPMTGRNAAYQEKISIPNVQFVAGSEGVNDTINLAVANIGYVSVTICGCIMKDQTGNTVTFIELGSSRVVLEKGTCKLITLTLNQDTLIDRAQYTLTAISETGGSFVSPAFDRSSTAEYDPLKDLDLQSMLQESALSTPPSQATLFGPVYAPIPTTVIVGSTIVAAFSVIGAYKLSQQIVDSKNRKDRYVVFFFISVIFVSIIVWFVSSMFWSSIAGF